MKAARHNRDMLRIPAALFTDFHGIFYVLYRVVRLVFQYDVAGICAVLHHPAAHDRRFGLRFVGSLSAAHDDLCLRILLHDVHRHNQPIFEILRRLVAAQTAAEEAQAQSVVEASARQAQENVDTPSSNTPSNDPSPSPSPSPAPSTPSGPTYNPVTGNAIVDRAYGCIGLPYDWGGVGPNAFDCSGLVGYAVTGSFSRWGTTNTYMGFSQVSDPQPGDIATSWDHCGIYIGNGQMIHAPWYGQPVSIGPVQGDMIIVRP